MSTALSFIRPITDAASFHLAKHRSQIISLLATPLVTVVADSEFVDVFHVIFHRIDIPP